MSTERQFILSEIAALEELLLRIPLERVIDRKGFEVRLAAAQELLEALPTHETSYKGRLLFRGKPVVDRHGIFASFAGKAAHAFSEAVAAVTEGLAGRLIGMGPIARGDRSNFLLVGTATGSFGFEFEVPVHQSLPEHDQPGSAELAVARIQDLFEDAAHGEGELLPDLVAEIHPRAVKKAREFLDVLDEYGAWCSLEYRDRPFRFRDLSEVNQTRAVLADDNISEYDQTFEGVMEGILPTARQIELRIPGETAPLRVRVGRDIENVGALKQFLDRPVRLELHLTQVANRKPRYELNSMPTAEDQARHA